MKFEPDFYNFSNLPTFLGYHSNIYFAVKSSAYDKFYCNTCLPYLVIAQVGDDVIGQVNI